MFNVGGGELLVIALVALIVLGPDRLPGALRTAGQWMGELRRISSGFQTDFKTALADAEREAEAAKKAEAPTLGELSEQTGSDSAPAPNAAAPMSPIPVPDPPPAEPAATPSLDADGAGPGDPRASEAPPGLPDDPAAP